jgi:hypothetical protein
MAIIGLEPIPSPPWFNAINVSSAHAIVGAR